MINKDIINAFAELAKEKNIDRTNLSTIIEEIFMSLIYKKYGEEQDNFSVIVNMDKGEIEIYQELLVVKNVKNSIEEISLEEAIKAEDDIELGEIFVKILNPENFGRRLINTAKQYLSQKIRDIERNSIFEEYSNKIGEIIVGNVHQIQRDRIFINSSDHVEFILPKLEQLPNDRYRRGESVRGIIKDVEIKSKGPEIIMSRSDDLFLKRLFEMEIPEIEDDIIEVKSVSRVPGDRSKIVVYSSDRRIDAVGACVGMRGSRIQSIVRELNGEKIDIINWSEKPEILISRALSPAKPLNLYIDEERPYALAVFEDEELPIAIGRNGQNIKLASSVTNYTIDAKKKSEHEGVSQKNVYIDELKSLTSSQIESLAKINVHTDSDYFETDKEEILALKGFGPKTYEKIKKLIDEASEELNKLDDTNKEEVESV